MGRFGALFAGVIAFGTSTAWSTDNKNDGWKIDQLDRNVPTIYHQALIFRKIAENNLVFECDKGLLIVRVIGFEPLQKFPQPELEVRFGDQAFSRIATAVYVKESKPSGPINIPQEKLAENLKGKNLGWPGHPAYSRLSINMPISTEFLKAFVSEEPVNLSFASQKLTFPKLDEAVAKKFVELCKSKA